jgi:hypothetical protein
LPRVALVAVDLTVKVGKDHYAFSGRDLIVHVTEDCFKGVDRATQHDRSAFARTGSPA